MNAMPNTVKFNLLPEYEVWTEGGALFAIVN